MKNEKTIDYYCLFSGLILTFLKSTAKAIVNHGCKEYENSRTRLGIKADVQPDL
jgi:hypothetical protein